MTGCSEKSNELKPFLVSTAEAAHLLSIGKTLLHQMCSDGRFGPEKIKLGKRTLFSVAEIQEWIKAGMPGRLQWEKICRGDKK